MLCPPSPLPYVQAASVAVMPGVLTGRERLTWKEFPQSLSDPQIWFQVFNCNIKSHWCSITDEQEVMPQVWV